MDLGVRGKGIVIVGGTSGMGLAAAQVLAAEGASLVLAGRDRDRADRAVASLPDGGGPAYALTVDVRHEGAVDRVLQEAVDVLGRLDGIAVMTGLSGHEPLDGHGRGVDRGVRRRAPRHRRGRARRAPPSRRPRRVDRHRGRLLGPCARTRAACPTAP